VGVARVLLRVPTSTSAPQCHGSTGALASTPLPPHAACLDRPARAIAVAPAPAHSFGLRRACRRRPLRLRPIWAGPQLFCTSALPTPRGRPSFRPPPLHPAPCSALQRTPRGQRPRDAHACCVCVTREAKRRGIPCGRRLLGGGSQVSGRRRRAGLRSMACNALPCAEQRRGRGCGGGPNTRRLWLLCKNPGGFKKGVSKAGRRARACGGRGARRRATRGAAGGRIAPARLRARQSGSRRAL
jgi:hypothetical protein